MLHPKEDYVYLTKRLGEAHQSPRMILEESNIAEFTTKVKDLGGQISKLYVLSWDMRIQLTREESKNA